MHQNTLEKYKRTCSSNIANHAEFLPHSYPIQFKLCSDSGSKNSFILKNCSFSYVLIPSVSSCLFLFFLAFLLIQNNNQIITDYQCVRYLLRIPQYPGNNTYNKLFRYHSYIGNRPKYYTNL